MGFNDPTAIAGFGRSRKPMDISVLLRQAFGQPSELATASCRIADRGGTSGVG